MGRRASRCHPSVPGPIKNEIFYVYTSPLWQFNSNKELIQQNKKNLFAIFFLEHYRFENIFNLYILISSRFLFRYWIILSIYSLMT